MTEMVGLALIVGSGFERLGFEIVERRAITTPYGETSSSVLTLRVGEARLPCIARHGEVHRLLPHEVNYRANVWALREHGARACIGLNTVGAIDPKLFPGELAVPEQLVDYTWGRESTYAGRGAPIKHAEFALPFSAVLRGRLVEAVIECGFDCRGGTYGVTQGPRLETAAEIDRLERDGCTMVGMTAMPEAALARELDLEYAICALAVNFAAGKGPGGEQIGEQIERFAAEGMRKLAVVIERLVATGPFGAL